MGSLISAEPLKGLTSYVDGGVEQGAELLVDGRGLSIKGFESGDYLCGFLFSHVKPDMTIYQQEKFGLV